MFVGITTKTALESPSQSAGKALVRVRSGAQAIASGACRTPQHMPAGPQHTLSSGQAWIMAAPQLLSRHGKANKRSSSLGLSPVFTTTEMKTDLQGQIL